jgi:hypothetical protein
MRDFDIKLKILDAIEAGTIKVDVGGHWGGLKKLSVPVEEFTHDLAMRMDPGLQAAKLIPVLDDPSLPPLDPPVLTDPNCLIDCWECGQEVAFRIDGRSMVAENPCPYPDGLPAIEFELNVPSGKMVVGNDFRDSFVVCGDFNVNKTSEIAKTCHVYAEVGLAHAYVGNTCPGMFKVDDGSFVIGVGGKTNPVKGSRRVAGICTDLWWYSIADYDEFVRRTGRQPDERTESVVNCRPGVYRFRHQYHLLDHEDYTKSQVYTYVDWVRGPDPLRDFLGEFMSLDYTAGQVLFKHIRDYPDLYNYPGYGPPSAASLQAAANRAFASGREYHPNGWLDGTPDMTPAEPDAEIPVFDETYYWDDVGEHHLLCQIAGVGKPFVWDRMNIYLNPSFTALAFNVLNCIIKYGVRHVRRPENDWVEKQRRETQKWAKKALLALARRWPDRVPDYCRETLDSLKKKRKK